MEELEPKSKKSTNAKAMTTLSEDDDDDNDDDDDDEAKETDDAPLGGWGPNKQSYYSTNDLDDLSSDSEMGEEERREMEVREVKRLQAKSRQGLVNEDFGLGQDSVRIEGSSAAREARRKEFDAEPITTAEGTFQKATVLEGMEPIHRAELISKVQVSTPETLALVGEYADIVEDIAVISKRLKRVTEVESREEVLGLCRLHHQILLTYATNLAFYFYLRASPKYAANPHKLASHGVISRLHKLKNGLQILDNFGFAADADTDSGEESASFEGDGDEENVDPGTNFLFQPKMFSRNGDDDDDDEHSESLGSLEDDELMQLDSEERENEQSAKSKAAAQAHLSKRAQNGKSKTKTSRAKRKPNKAEVAPLAHVIDAEDEDDSFGALKSHKKKSPRAQVAVTDVEAFHAFGEPTQLSASDSADKEAKRKSLKFYTGQIDAKEARKAGGSGLGGDSDIPYRDRERSRMAVADANARRVASTNGQVNRALNGDDFGEEDMRDWKDVMDVRQSDGKKSKERGDGDDEELDYYDLVASGKRSAKRAKKEEYDEDRASQRVNPDYGLEEGEHRGISRTIEKNRGLTPRRPKENRNPRVKKRKRFEKAQKKLSSKGPVYKGGQGALQGGYSGETSGINSNVVKSRQFA